MTLDLSYFDKGDIMELLPVEYQLKVYEGSFANEPSWTIRSASPLSAMSVGDYFTQREVDRWYTEPQHGEKLKIKEIEHVVWELENKHVSHMVMILLEPQNT